MDTIKRPIITEKSMFLASTGWYTFAVALKARKEDIVKAIHALYSVSVRQVRTMRVAGKTRKVGKKAKPVTRIDWKKALVRLEKGQKISVFEASQQSGK
ncbi:MAG: 50S ribosomal protein L23 [Patescibacteria group bacterium]